MIRMLPTMRPRFRSTNSILFATPSVHSHTGLFSRFLPAAFSRLNRASFHFPFLAGACPPRVSHSPAVVKLFWERGLLSSSSTFRSAPFTITPDLRRQRWIAYVSSRNTATASTSCSSQSIPVTFHCCFFSDSARLLECQHRPGPAEPWLHAAVPFPPRQNLRRFTLFVVPSCLQLHPITGLLDRMTLLFLLKVNLYQKDRSLSSACSTALQTTTNETTNHQMPKEDRQRRGHREMGGALAPIPMHITSHTGNTPSTCTTF
ncbi:hypothetical protein BJV78DRAFT_1243092 [Lactifluus subvellereus]|nr:hypothetical protein BJV78DRAFT_1243092 [Lactifluus subvellereus]